MLSLSARLLIAASVVLVAFLGLTGWVLDQAFRDSARTAAQERLQGSFYILLGAAEFDAKNRLYLPRALAEARFSAPGSGLYAEVVDEQSKPIWRSDSMLGIRLQDAPVPQRPGIPIFSPGEVINGIASRDNDANNTDNNPLIPVFIYGYTVSWEVAADQYHRYTFRVIETQQGFRDEVSGFARSLWSWLLGVTLLLLAVQGVILRWGLQPLRKVAVEVSDIENGIREELSGRYPPELQPLTENLNNLVRASRNHMERYRNALGDLAHSLKTPLAVLQGLLSGDAQTEELRTTMSSQLERMNQTVAYQLQRAAASGRPILAKPLLLLPLVSKVMDSLAKVYGARNLDLSIAISGAIQVRGDEGDLLEIIGNLADNACKWADTKVKVSAHQDKHYVYLCVEDDGLGIAEELRSQILERGLRADQDIPGHGIGLAIVRDIVEEVYRGELEIGASELGGAKLRVKLKTH